MTLHLTNDHAIADAVERDLEDADRLTHILGIVTSALDAMIPEAADLRHPDCRWQPDDLLEVLQDQAKSIRWELDRVTRGMLVLDPA